jgi:hypothetical protein
MNMEKDDDSLKRMNENYEHDKKELEKSGMCFGNMNYYLKKEEYIKNHLWKNSKQVHEDIINEMKSRIR